MNTLVRPRSFGSSPVARVRQFLGSGRKAPATRQSSVENIYHCCVHKTASQWIARILAAPETHQGCGLRTHAYQSQLPGGADTRNIDERTFDHPFPRRCIVTPIYIGREAFLDFPKPAAWRAFVVVRDPRDVVVSWYYSWKHSHPLMGDVSEQRRQLNALNQEAGLCCAIERLRERGLFSALASWVRTPLDNSAVALFRYEDLVERPFETFQKLFAHCDIAMPDGTLRALLNAHSFAALTEGRPRGVEDITSHLRKGAPGDWRNHFTPAVTAAFQTRTGDLVTQLGYPV